MSDPTELVPFELDVAGRRIAGLRTPAAGLSPDAPRLLCLHGWLDDAASFVPLARHLDGVELVALDLPGHGASAHAPDGYTLFDMALTVRRSLGALGWERCHLVGHSLGANIAPWLAAAAPEVVERLIMIEGVGPYTEPAEALPARLRRAFADRLDTGRYAVRTFANLDAAVDHRLKHASLSREAATLIMARQTEPVSAAPGEPAGRVRWRFDPALRHASAEYRTEAQVLAVLAAIECPVLVVLADAGHPRARPETRARLEAMPDVRTVRLPGGHHLHMDDPAPTAEAIRRFVVRQR